MSDTGQDILSLLLNPTPEFLAEIQANLYPALTTPAEILQVVGRAVLTEVTSSDMQSPIGRTVRVLHNEFVGTITRVTRYEDDSALEVEVRGPSGAITDSLVTYIEGLDITAKSDEPGEAYLIFTD